MKTFRKKISAVLLSVYMVFGVVSTDYLEVKAFEWIVPAIGIEEALKVLLLALGVCVGGEVASEIDWSTLKEDCITFQENQGNSQVAVSQWWADVISGKLDQASDCWSSFKQWVSSLVNSGDLTTVSGVVDYLNKYYGGTFELNYNNIDVSNYKVGSFCMVKGSGNNVFLFPSKGYAKHYTSSLYGIYSSEIASSSDFMPYGYFFNYGLNGTSILRSGNGSASFTFNATSDLLFFNTTLVSDSAFPFTGNITYLDSTGDFVAYDDDVINDIAFAPSDSVDVAIPDVMPLPWENVGDTDDEINERINGVIDAVNTGNLSLADAMKKILDLLNALAVDTTADDALVPENPDKPDETYPDRVQENQDNLGFTLAGFEKLFPFCIPFDIYAFMTLLVAEPVAPVIEYPIYNPVTNQNEIITIDFSTWYSVVKLFRYIFDFLFIIGMLLIARALIGGGDKA